MGFHCGIIGLPNVGKSTIFNALTSAGAQAANYPFCTIEPNTGVVAVADSRLEVLASIAKSQQIIPTSVEFVDIAGLVKGASVGEGLGNQFLGHIRSVDAVVHVVRCFEDDNIVHVEGGVNPRRDVEVIETELMLADLAVVEKRLERTAKAARTGDKEALAEQRVLEHARDLLGRGQSLRDSLSQEFDYSAIGLITAKPLLFLANVDEKTAATPPTSDAGGYLGELVAVAQERGVSVVVISGRVEEELSQLDPEGRQLFLEDMGLERSGLERLALEGHKLLNLISFFTVGPKEARAWTCRNGENAVDAAGKIHSDIARGFIRAEVISYEHYVSSGGESGAREKGVMRLEGKAYTMQDGDVVHFRFNV